VHALKEDIKELSIKFLKNSMKNIIIIILFFCSATLFAQGEKENYKEVASKFRSHYNTKSYDSIFLMFDAAMKEALPKEKTNIFFSELNKGYGSMNTMEFLDLENGAHVYKTTFDTGLRNVLIYLDPENKIGGLLIKSHIQKNLPKLERNITKMIAPFKEQWFVFWGGETVAQNYHMADENQKYAYDLLMVNEGSSYKGDPKKNESYLVFGKDIIAPCDAKVIKVIKGVIDNVPGELNPKELTGNTIVLETAEKEFILFAHLMKNSILVKVGDIVKQGQVMAQCGNSGNSTEAHLHLQLQNVADFFQATGAKMYFDKIMVNGKIKEDYIPVKEDYIKNIN
jgi:murein DD-endopeptidase MepM/ murein hydrolase activator NlpD